MPTVKRQLEPVPFTGVTFDDAFLGAAHRGEPHGHLPAYTRMEETGRISAFDLNFQRPVPSPIVLIFGDSDPAKWIEAASYSLATHPDPELEALVDEVADKIISAQQPDGYLNTHFIHIQPEMRWKNLRDWHEMYCAGHLIEGAVAHYQATGKRKLLDALCRYADHIDDTFGREPGKKRGYCGHPEIELALVKLYHATGNRRYLELATTSSMSAAHGPSRIITTSKRASAAKIRPSSGPRRYEYCQAQVPIREQTKVVGHAVRAMYLLSAAADLADENDDADAAGNLRPAVGQPDHQAHVPDRRDRPVAPQRRLHRGLRPARRNRLRRNLRDDRPGDCGITACCSSRARAASPM